MWGLLGLFNGLSDSFMKGHRHLQLDLDMMEKRVKLLAIYDAFPPRVWEEMALHAYVTLQNFQREYVEYY